MVIFVLLPNKLIEIMKKPLHVANSSFSGFEIVNKLNFFNMFTE